MKLTRGLAVLAMLALLVPAVLYGQWIYVLLGLVGVAAFAVPYLTRNR
jgi:hypothetical protein